MGYVAMAYDRGAWDKGRGIEESVLNPRFFKMLPNGDFETEQYEDEKEWVSEEDDEEQGKFLDKRVVVIEESQPLLDDGKQKKGRFEPPSNIPM